MMLQLAIDRPQGLSVIRQVADLVDILEVGTPMLNRFGLAVISTVRELAPGVPILVDAKVVDGGTQGILGFLDGLARGPITAERFDSEFLDRQGGGQRGPCSGRSK